MLRPRFHWKKSPLAYCAGFAPIERFLGRCLFFQELHKFVSVEPLNLQFEFLTKKTMRDQAESNEGENEVEMRIRTHQGKHLWSQPVDQPIKPESKSSPRGHLQSYLPDTEVWVGGPDYLMEQLSCSASVRKVTTLRIDLAQGCGLKFSGKAL